MAKGVVGILALDLGCKTGWAHSNGRSGVHDFKMGYKEAAGQLWNLYYKWLYQRIHTHFPDTKVIVYESSLNQPGHAARVVNAMVAITEMAAIDLGCEVKHYHQMTIKKHATGTARHPKGTSKVVMYKAAKARHPTVELIDDNHIDALFLLDLSLSMGDDVSSPRKI